MEKILSKIKRIHLVGIGGVGMSGLAMLLKDKGYQVSGSDVKESFYLAKIKEQGIQVSLGHDAAHVREAELVCYSSAIKENNIEIVEARRRRIPIVRRGYLLSLISQDRKVIAISGSHGKTTTSALITYLLTSLGYNPAAFIGSYPLNYDKMAWWGNDFFVIEVDESDGSFSLCSPWVGLITNIDREHLDFYKSEDALKESFSKFAHSSKEMTIGWGDCPPVAAILKDIPSLKYGFSHSNHIRAENVFYDSTSGYMCFDLLIKEKRYHKVKSPLLGEHNVLNTLAAISFFYFLGEDIDSVLMQLPNFKSTKRRFQIQATVGGVTFIDDYAHHPTEIQGTLAAARLLAPGRIVAIFQPHRFSRIQLLIREFARSFSLCDSLIITDIYSAGEMKPQGFNQEMLFKHIIDNFSKEVVYIPCDMLSREVPTLLKEGDLVLGLGAGDIHKLLDGIIDEFKRCRVKV